MIAQEPLQLKIGKAYEGVVSYLYPGPAKPLPEKENKPVYYKHKFILLVDARYFGIFQKDAKPIQVNCEYLSVNQVQSDFRLGERVIFHLKNYYYDIANVYVGSRDNLLTTESELIQQAMEQSHHQQAESQSVQMQSVPIQQPPAETFVRPIGETLTIVQCLHHMINHYSRKGSFTIDTVWNDVLYTYEHFNGFPFASMPGEQVLNMDQCMAFAIPFCKARGFTKVEDVCVHAARIYRKINGLES
jgi:hypothetical protein